MALSDSIETRIEPPRGGDGKLFALTVISICVFGLLGTYWALSLQ
jgi:hypothetical protein